MWGEVKILLGSVIPRLCPNCKAFTHAETIRCDCGFREVPQLITLDAYIKGSPPSDTVIENAKDLLLKANSLFQDLGLTSVTLTSGFRTFTQNRLAGGAPTSNHMTGRALDIADNDRKIGNKLMDNPSLLTSRGMAMEDLAYCVRANGNKWVHLQSVLPKSGRVVFIPYAGPPKIV